MDFMCGNDTQNEIRHFSEFVFDVGVFFTGAAAAAVIVSMEPR